MKELKVVQPLYSSGVALDCTEENMYPPVTDVFMHKVEKVKFRTYKERKIKVFNY